MTGRLKSLTMDHEHGTQILTLTVYGDFRETYDELSDQLLDISLKKHRERRSLDANAYCWVLADKIAEKLRISKAEVYRNAIRDIGGVSEILCIRNDAVDKFREIWGLRGVGWQTETMPSKIQGCTNVIAYYGSSVFDTKQMSDLIDHLVQDASELGIQTITPMEKAMMLRRYTSD